MADHGGAAGLGWCWARVPRIRAPSQVIGQAPAARRRLVEQSPSARRMLNVRSADVQRMCNSSAAAV